MEIYINQVEKRSWVEVDLNQIRQNFALYKKILPDPTEIMVVIKADAYGHGDVAIAKALIEEGVRYFAVSNIDEAIGLRDAGINSEILILGYSSPIYAEQIYENNLTQAVISDEYAGALAEKGYRIKVHFAIDTGMNRIGLDADCPETCEHLIRKYSEKFVINGVFTHLCVADIENEESRMFTTMQIQKFKDVVARINDMQLPFVHCFNSAGGLYYLNNSLSTGAICKLVRLGIILYGLKPNYSNLLPYGIRPALSWKSVISQVKYVEPGETIGYGRSYTAKKKMLVATVTTGYADGYNRALSNKGFVLIKGRRAPIVGRICMDQTLVDVTNISEAKMGDIVVLLGVSEGVEYNADDMAKDLGTIGYEIICNISKRVQRFYL